MDNGHPNFIDQNQPSDSYDMWIRFLTSWKLECKESSRKKVQTANTPKQRELLSLTAWRNYQVSLHLLTMHRRKTFVIGFIMSAKSVLQLSNRLLSRIQRPFDYFLSYKLSQDHLELLFSCIRGRNGFNNNPNVRQFKNTMQKILLIVLVSSY